MAEPLGFFDAELRQEGWFGADQVIEGWFAHELILSSVTSTPLVIQDALHGHAAENLVLTQHNILAIQDALHAHAAENLVLVQHNILVVQDAAHAHAAENLALLQHNLLAIADALHAHFAENVVLVIAGQLEIQDALHAHFADNLDLVFHAATDAGPPWRMRAVEQGLYFAPNPLLAQVAELRRKKEERQEIELTAQLVAARLANEKAGAVAMVEEERQAELQRLARKQRALTNLAGAKVKKELGSLDPKEIIRQKNMRAKRMANLKKAQQANRRKRRG